MHFLAADGLAGGFDIICMILWLLGLEGWGSLDAGGLAVAVVGEQLLQMIKLAFAVLLVLEANILAIFLLIF